jgi:hypothetical protein
VTAPLSVDATKVYEFIGQSDLAVLLVSVHPWHTFNAALPELLASDDDDVACGTVDLTALVASGGSVLRFLHQGLRRCGAPSVFGVLPGYYFFQKREMVAWDAGLPAIPDVEALARSALLGAIWSGVNHDMSFMGQALHLAADHAAAERLAAVFRAAIAAARARRDAPGDAPRDSGPRPVDDLYWAYHTLGVLPTATDRDVHDAWRRKRMEVHPDHAGSDPAEFARRSRLSQELNRARDIIVNHRRGAPGAAQARAS